MATSDSNLEKVKKGVEAVFGDASPLGGTMDHSMLEKSPTNKLVFDGWQAQLDLALRGTQKAMIDWENIDLNTGKHKNFRMIEDPITKKEAPTPIWVNNHTDIEIGLMNVENAQLTCGGYSREQFLGQIASQTPVTMPVDNGGASILDKVKGFFRRK